MSKLYAQRDYRALGDYYLKHIEAMTEEKLHSKADIAAELAIRDRKIKELEKALHTLYRQMEEYLGEKGRER